MNNIPARLLSVQVELTFGCNYRCAFCGLRAFPPEMKPKFMSVLTADVVGAELCRLPAGSIKVWLGMLGEPTLNPRLMQILDRVGSIRTKHQTVMITNGSQFGRNPRLLPEILERIDYVIIDIYHEQKEDFWAAVNGAGANVVDFYSGEINVWANNKRRVRNTIVLMDDLAKRSGERRSRKLHNYAGNVPGQAVNPPGSCRKVCAEPLRELSIKWDGTIPICCNDAQVRYRVGSVHSGIQETWASRRFEAARRLLRRGQRDFAPCNVCNICLPAQYTIGSTGAYPLPTEADRRMVAETNNDSQA